MRLYIVCSSVFFFFFFFRDKCVPSSSFCVCCAMSFFPPLAGLLQCSVVRQKELNTRRSLFSEAPIYKEPRRPTKKGGIKNSIDDAAVQYRPLVLYMDRPKKQLIERLYIITVYILVSFAFGYLIFRPCLIYLMDTHNVRLRLDRKLENLQNQNKQTNKK